MPRETERARRPALTAVVLGYRNEATIIGAVASLLRQEAPDPFEVVVVTSGGDRSAALARKHFPCLRVIESPTRLLPGAARNVGIAAARGDVVAFLAADCTAAPGWIAGRLAAHAAGYAAVASSVGRSGRGTPWEAAWHYLLYCSRLPGRPAGPVSFPDPAAHGMSFSRSLLDELGPFDEARIIGEDTAFSQLLAERGVGVWFESGVQAVHPTPPRVRDVVTDQWRRGRTAGRQQGPAWPGVRSAVIVKRAVRLWLNTVRYTIRRAWRFGTGERWTVAASAPFVAFGAAARVAGWTSEQLRAGGR